MFGNPSLITRIAIGKGIGFAMKSESGTSIPLRAILAAVMQKMGFFSTTRSRRWPRASGPTSRTAARWSSAGSKS